jgi:hypothetical protein
MAPAADLPQRLLAFVRRVAPFAYCDPCLAIRVDATPTETTAAVSGLIAEGVLARARRVCYGCGRTLEVATLREVPPRAVRDRGH